MTSKTLPVGSGCLDSSTGYPTALPIAEPTPRRNQRRRLWQLPTQAHELLLAMSFTPEWLRREAARTLGQIHKGRCVLKGRDVDVLYSVVHDMVTRNPLSEALHKHLDARHALALRALAAAKDEPALQFAWCRARDDDSSPAAAPAALWAVLTHPLGEAVQSAVLYDARAWVFAHARRSVEQALVGRQIEALGQQARQRSDDLQARLTTLQQQSAQAQRLALAEIAHLRGELERLQATACLVKVPSAAERRIKPAEEPVANRARGCEPNPKPTAKPTQTHASPPAPAAVRGKLLVPPSPSLHVAGRRVLLVGGIQHAVARYRGRIEGLGGRFEHHDGGIEDGAQALDSRLGRAEVVICQAACINHEAYHRVKRHCERTGTPCVYLDRPSLSRLDRALAFAQGPQHASS